MIAPRGANRVALASLLLFATVASAAPQPQGPSPLERGIARFRERDFAGALPDLEVAHAAFPRDADIALLLGIALYRTGRSDDALPLLQVAAASPDEETGAAARIFLGLIADESGAADTSRALLLAAAGSRSSALADSGRALLDRAAPHRLAVTLLLRPEFDSNVTLLPSMATAGTPGQADGSLLFLAALSFRPLRSIGLLLEAVASYRQQLRLLDYDLFAHTLAARYLYRGTRDRFFAEYAFELVTLGSALLDLGHLLQTSYRRALYRDVGVAARYTFRHRTYLPAGYAAFTGPSHSGALEASFGTPQRPLQVDLGYLLLRESTADPLYSATGHGARLNARARFASRYDLALTASVIARAFDRDTSASAARSDVQLSCEISLAIELNRWLGVIAGASAQRNLSSSADFDYLKVTAWAGVAFGYAGL
ncbi:MAG: tetratricopeptide repeat protein [Myxococcales bacterium]|nr:tetratricopeptide repeat protein [Myxococcales bacterium]